MATTYTLIASSTVGAGGAATVQFSSIPATYTDLKIVSSARVTSGSATTYQMYFNSDSTITNYYTRWLEGSGASATSANYNANYMGYVGDSTYTASTFSNDDIYIPNYAGSNSKSFGVDNVNENNATTAYTHLTALRWTGTAAITQITLYPNSGSFAQYSTFYLYGIKNS